MLPLTVYRLRGLAVVPKALCLYCHSGLLNSAFPDGRENLASIESDLATVRDDS